jgi:hypothetical protein
MNVEVHDRLDAEVAGALRTDALRTHVSHDSAVLAAARAFCEPPRARRLRFAVPLALAASLVIFTVAVVLEYSNPLVDDGRVRGASNVDAAGLVPQNGATLEGLPAEFHWPAQAGAESYRVVVRDVSGAPIWRSVPVEANRAAIDAGLREAKARTYYWTVEVEGIGGGRELGPFWFQLQ